MNDTDENTKMSESVQIETITKTEKNGADSSSSVKHNSLRHRKIPSADLNNVSVHSFLFI